PGARTAPRRCSRSTRGSASSRRGPRSSGRSASPTRGATRRAEPGVLADRVAGLPRCPGVYRFRDGRGRVLYLGRAGDLRSRVRSYWGDLADRPHLRRMVRRVASIDVLECVSEHEAAFVERRLLERRCPPYNRVVADSVEAYLGYDDASGLAFARE